MVRIERHAIDAKALVDQGLALLLDNARLSVMARRAQRHQLIERGKRIAACIDTDDMIDSFCNDEPLLLEAQLAQRILL
jgi:hypothetical protein